MPSRRCSSSSSRYPASLADTALPAIRAVVQAPHVLDAARRLLGMRIRTAFDGRATEVALTEVEAYDGPNDPASHAFSGRTARNATMFGPAGGLYVYRSYGLHWCMNIATGAEGDPAAVLLRGGEVVAGAGSMVERRGRADHLTDGPGKLTQALGVSGAHDGTSVLDGPVRLLEPIHEIASVTTTTRIGISKAMDRPWRFVAELRS